MKNRLKLFVFILVFLASIIVANPKFDNGSIYKNNKYNYSNTIVNELVGGRNSNKSENNFYGAQNRQDGCRLCVACDSNFFESSEQIGIFDNLKLCNNKHLCTQQNINLGQENTNQVQANYTIRHWQESLTPEGATLINGKYYTLFEVDDSQFGAVNENTSALANKYTGFTAQNIIQKAIAEDGSTVVDVLYNRNQYTLTLVKEDGVEEVFGEGQYLFGQNVQITAILKDGYNWNLWKSSNETYCPNSDKVEYSFTMPASQLALVASAKLKQYTITVLQAENGSISAASDSYNHGTVAHFTIKANAGYHVKALIIDGQIYTSNLNEYTFTDINSNHTISAIFAVNTSTKYTVRHWKESLQQQGAELINGKYYELVAVDTSKEGTTNADTNVIANNYVGFTAQTIEQQKILADESTVVDVLYTRNYYTLQLIAGKGIDSVLGDGEYLYGQSVTISATVKEGYNWSAWESFDTTIFASSNNIEYSFVMPANSIQLTATTALKQYTVTIIPTENGQIIPGQNQTLNHGSNLILDILPNVGYKLSALLIDGTNMVALVKNGKYTISNITEHKTIVATFERIKYRVIASCSEGGSISLSSETSVNYDDNLTFNLTPNNGYEVKAIYINGASVGATDTYTITNIKADQTISVEFGILTYDVIINITGKGSISANKGLTNLNYGETRTIILNQEKGWKLVGVYVDGQEISVQDNTLVLSNISKDMQVQVIFEQIKIDLMIPIIIASSTILILLILIIAISRNKKLKKKLALSNEEDEIQQLANKNKQEVIKTSNNNANQMTQEELIEKIQEVQSNNKEDEEYFDDYEENIIDGEYAEDDEYVEEDVYSNEEIEEQEDELVTSADEGNIKQEASVPQPPKAEVPPKMPEMAIGQVPPKVPEMVIGQVPPKMPKSPKMSEPQKVTMPPQMPKEELPPKMPDAPQMPQISTKSTSIMAAPGALKVENPPKMPDVTNVQSLPKMPQQSQVKVAKVPEMAMPPKMPKTSETAMSPKVAMPPQMPTQTKMVSPPKMPNKK